MKLRIRGNSIRLRLGRSEVARLGTDGHVEETIAFGPNEGDVLSYALATSAEVVQVAARMTPGAITVLLPVSVAGQWVATDQVTIAAEQPGVGPDGAGVLRILVEKDFTCLHTGSDESGDTYPRTAGAPPG